MVGFIIYVIVSIITPGPNNIYASVHASKYGITKTIPFNLGVLIGTFIVFLFTSYINHVIFTQTQSLMKIIGILGGLYILFLSIGMLYKETSKTVKKPIKNPFSTAIILQFINPKTMIFGLTVATFYVQLYHNSSHLFWLSLINAILCFLSVMAWSLLGKLFSEYIHTYQRLFRITMAALLGYSGIIIILESI